MLLLVIACAEKLIDKSLQGLQARLNDRLYKKTGTCWPLENVSAYCITFYFLFAVTMSLLLVVLPFGGSFFAGHLSTACNMYLMTNKMKKSFCSNMQCSL